MAKFIINSSQTAAVRLDQINAVFINEVKHGLDPSTYVVIIRSVYVGPVEFEFSNTLDGAKASTIMMAIET